MPRWNTLAIKGFSFYEDNVVSVFSDYRTSFNFKNHPQTIPNDLKVSYSGDISLGSDDLVLAYNVEAFVQRLYFFLITRKGFLPGDENFGTHLEDVIGTTERPNLNFLIQQLNKDLREFEDIEYINDIKAALVQDEQTYIEINLDLKIKGFKYKLLLDLELF